MELIPCNHQLLWS